MTPGIQNESVIVENDEVNVSLPTFESLHGSPGKQDGRSCSASFTNSSLRIEPPRKSALEDPPKTVRERKVERRTTYLCAARCRRY